MLERKWSENRLFDDVDFNKNGKISLLELNVYLKKLNFKYTDNEVISFLKMLDKNNDNLVDLSEFFDFLFGEITTQSLIHRRTSHIPSIY